MHWLGSFKINLPDVSASREDFLNLLSGREDRIVLLSTSSRVEVVAVDRDC